MEKNTHKLNMLNLNEGVLVLFPRVIPEGFHYLNSF